MSNTTDDVDLAHIKTKPFRGFGERIDGFIKEAAQRFGMDEKTLRGFVKMEGGWTGKDSQTGAIGVGQFTEGAWTDLVKTKTGKSIGMTHIGSCFQKACDPRRDDRVNTLATAFLMTRNAVLLKKYSIPATPENLYMAHNMGARFCYGNLW